MLVLLLGVLGIDFENYQTKYNSFLELGSQQESLEPVSLETNDIIIELEKRIQELENFGRA